MRLFLNPNLTRISPETVSINDYYSAMDKELSSVLKTSEADMKLPADLDDTELETNLGKI